jgi:hypothetical protein
MVTLVTSCISNGKKLVLTLFLKIKWISFRLSYVRVQIICGKEISSAYTAAVFISCGGVRLSPFGTSAPSWPLYQLRMMMMSVQQSVE